MVGVGEVGENLIMIGVENKITGFQSVYVGRGHGVEMDGNGMDREWTYLCNPASRAGCSITPQSHHTQPAYNLKTHSLVLKTSQKTV